MYQGGSDKVTAEAFTDPYCGSSTDDLRSVSGFMVMIGHAPVVSNSKYQRIVPCRSAKVAYIALSLCTQEVLWVSALIENMSREKDGGTPV